MRWILFFIFISLSASGQPQEASKIVVDLKPQWLIQQNGRLIPFENQSVSSVFFWVDGQKDKASVLCLQAKNSFSVFINSKLIAQRRGKYRFSIDSLARLYSTQLFIGIYTPSGIGHVHSELEKLSMNVPRDLAPLKGNYFLNFTILASLLMCLCFILFLRTNPMLTFDYLNVNKLFSFQDRDESTLTLRIGSSVNLLIYAFGSMFLALVILIALHLMGEQLIMVQWFPIQSVGQGFWQWSILSMLIFGLLMAKLFWLVILCALFGFKDTVRIQFFNFVRVILLAITLMSALNLIYFISNIRDERYFFHLLTILSIWFIIGAIITYFKLMARMPFHFFHLFSYLCASEIIPLMILMKVFFY